VFRNGSIVRHVKGMPEAEQGMSFYVNIVQTMIVLTNITLNRYHLRNDQYCSGFDNYFRFCFSGRNKVVINIKNAATDSNANSLLNPHEP